MDENDVRKARDGNEVDSAHHSISLVRLGGRHPHAIRSVLLRLGFDSIQSFVFVVCIRNCVVMWVWYPS